MDLDGINTVIRDVFGPSYQSNKVINGWVSIRCPLAQWQPEHRHGHDNRESAGVSINPNGNSVFNCFTCGNKAPFQGMLRKWAGFTGEDLEDIIKELDEEAYLGPRAMPAWESLKGGGIQQQPLDKALYLDLYEPAAGHPYLRKRGIGAAAAELMGLMVDPCDPLDGEERILFPIFGRDGELYGLSGRATNPDAKLKVRDYQGFKKALNILGCHLIEPGEDDKILVVEGLIDCASCWECGFPGVAVMHSTMTEAQAAIIRDIGLPVYLFYDNDAAGEKGVEEAGKLLYRYLPVMKVRYPEDVKDPGELTAEDFQAMIEDARLF